MILHFTKDLEAIKSCQSKSIAIQKNTTEKVRIVEYSMQ